MLDQNFNGLFRPVRGIRSYQHFQLDNSGDVIAKISCDSEQEKRIPLLKRGVTTERVKQAELPTVITPPGISQDVKNTSLSRYDHMFGLSLGTLLVLIHDLYH